MTRKLAAVACALLVAATTSFGQVTQTWSGAGDGTNVDVAANYASGTLPNTANNDTAQFNGTPAGPLNLDYHVGNFQSGPGSSGINLDISPNQTAPVSIATHLSASVYMAIAGINIEAGSGGLTLGNTNAATLYEIIGRPSGAVHSFVNNSAYPAIINPRVRFAAGGGAAWTMDFSGTGNWYCTNELCNDNSAGMIIQLDGPGNMYWNASAPNVYVANSAINSPVVINAGALVLEGNNPKLSNQNFTLGGTFEFAAPSQAQTLTGIFSGAGTNIVDGGTLTLSGASTYTGDTVLNGGEVIVYGAETPGTSGPLGVGTIDFNGGTLGFSVNNTFDYSSRFNTAAGQVYSFDTGGQNVTLAGALASSGGTLAKLGSGTLTLSGANAYSGATTISAGKLEIQGAAGSGSITVANSTTLGVTETGPQITPASLTVGTSSSASLEFNNVTSSTTPSIAAGTVTAGGPITVNVQSGSFSIGRSYPLFSWSSGPAPAVTLGTLVGAGGNLSTNGNTIQLNVTSLAFVWSGLNNDNWDLTTANNWKVNGVSQIFANGGTALLDDTLTTANTNIVLNSAVSPGSATVNSSVKPYSITSSGANLIGGTGGLTKNGTTTLALSGGVNTYTGPTTISSGILSVGVLANGGSASDIGAANNTASSLVINSGTLQYTGSGATSDHLFTVGTAGATLDNEGGTLELVSAGPVALSGAGARTLNLTGSDTSGDVLAASLADNGGATALAKAGAGTWILTGTNSYSGGTTIHNGILQVDQGGTTGTLGTGPVVDNATVDFDRANTLTVGSAISGTGSLIDNGTGTLILTGNNSYIGGTTVNNGILQVGNGGASGTLYANGNITINNTSTFIFDSTTPLTLSGYQIGLQGTGNVIVRPGSSLTSYDQNSYTGWTEIDPGATFQPCYGNEGLLDSSVVTNNGTFLLIRQDTATFIYAGPIVGSGKVAKDNNNANTGDATLTGVGNSYTGGTWIGGGGIILGDDATSGAGWLPTTGPVVFTNTTTPYLTTRYLNFNIVDNYVVTNNIISAVTDGSSTANSGYVSQNASSTLTLIGNNTYVGGTVINAGVVQIGNGGTTGSLGTGAVTDNGELDFNLASSLTFSNAISGSGNIVQLGSGTTILTGANTYTGSTTVSNGVLVLDQSSVGGDLDLDGGVVSAGLIGSVSNLVVDGNLNINSGVLVATLNKSLAPSNTTFTVSGGITEAGGSLVLTNFGPTLAVGDRFVIFNQATTGSALTVQSKGFTVANNLATDGSVTVTSVTVTPTSVPITATYSGGLLNLSWPAGSGLHLQAQTNSLAVGLSNNWVNVGGVTGNSYSTTPGTAKGAVFYRLSQ